MATPTFFTGWEHGSVADSPGTGLFAAGAQLPESIGTNPPSIELTTVHHGTKALRVGSGGTSTSYWRIDVAAAATQHIVTAFYFYLPALPTGGDQWLYTHFTTAGGQIFAVQTNGVCKMLPANRAADQQTGPTLSAGQWYRLDMYSNTSGVNHTIDWKIDGVAQTQAVTTNSPGADTADSFGIGNGLVAATAYDCIYDCFAASFTAGDYPLPDYYVLGFAPNEDTDISQVGAGAFVDAAGTAISAGNPAWDNLDSRDFDQSAERVEQTAVATGGFIEIGFENSGEATAPVAVMAEGAFRADANQACDIEVRLRSGTNEDSWANGDPSESTNVRGWKLYATEPVSGNAWTDALFDALRMRFGYSSDATPDPWVTALLLEALFQIAAGDQTVSPNALALTLAPVAPRVDLSLTPAALGLTLATVTPTRLDLEVSPAALGLSLLPVAPAVQSDQEVSPAALGLTLAPVAPRVDQEVSPAALGLVFAPVAPTRIDQEVAPGAVALSLAPVAPTRLDQEVLASALALTLSLAAPSVAFTVNPGPISLTAAPVAFSRIDQQVLPAALALALANPAPELGSFITPDPLGLTVSPLAPTRIDLEVLPSPVGLVVVAVTPSRIDEEVRPGAVSLTLTANAFARIDEQVLATAIALALTPLAPSVNIAGATSSGPPRLSTLLLLKVGR